MPKEGILHDYDLRANLEPTAQNHTCVVCGAHPTRFQWSDLSGEAMCTACGTPYQLKWGTEEQKAEGKYPYLNLKESWVPIIRQYFQETGLFTCLGSMTQGHPSEEAFERWLRDNLVDLPAD